MVSLFNKANKLKNNGNKPVSISSDHQEFLKRIKKSLYYGPSNPNRMTSEPLAQHIANMFDQTQKNYSLKTLQLDQISRIRQQTPCTLILSMIYLERLNKLDPNFVKLISPSELFLVTLMVSTKFYSDYDELEVFASTWAEEGQISMERLKELEISFLNAIQWNIFVKESEFFEKLRKIEKLLATKEGCGRGWFTYTELELLMPTIELAKQIMNVTTILMFSYACSIMTIALSSVILASIPAPLTQPIQHNGESNALTCTFIPDVNSTLISDNVDNNDDEINERCFLNDAIKKESNEADSHTCNVTINFPLYFIDGGSWNWNGKSNYQDTGENFHWNIVGKINPVPILNW